MDAFEGLLTQPSASSPSPELLEMLGRKAAQMFTGEQKLPLNDGISQLIAQHPGLNNEHIRRIVEFANNSAFQTLFEQSTDKNVHFAVADPGAIIRDTKDGGTPAFDGQTLDGGKSDYLTSPRAQGDLGDAELSQAFTPQSEGMPKVAFVDQAAGYFVGKHYGKKQKERGEAHNFGGRQAASLLVPGGIGYQIGRSVAHNEKTAEEVELPHTLHANPVYDVYDAHVRAEAARQDLASQNDQAEMGLKDAYENVYQAVRNEVIDPDGSGLNGAITALQKVAAQVTMDSVLPEMVSRMFEEGISLDLLDRSLVKTAGVVVNPDHPLVVSWLALEKAAEARVLIDYALRDADAALAESRTFLRVHGR